jgi:hypothetical protein
LEVLYGIAEAGTYVSAPMDVFSLESEEPVSVFATHDSGGYYPVVTWALDQEYQLQSDAAQNYQWSMDQVYSLVFPVPEWTVDSEWSTLTYQGVEWPLESQWSTGEEQWGLDIFYALSGSQVLHEFKGHINTLRSGLDLPPYDICVRNLPDIAQRHSLHMRETLIQEHDGAHLPVGWQTFADRVTRLGDSYPAAENLASVWVLRNSNDQATALEYYDAWYASTEHYDNMVFDFGLDAILEFQLGIEYYLPYVVSGGTQYGPSETHWIAIATLNLINFNPPGDRVAVEFSLNSQYATYSPTRENLDMCWTTYAYKHVSTSHKTKYALRVAAAHSGSYGTYVTAAHTALLQYSIQVGLAAPYGSTVFISAQHVGAYDIEEYARVVAAHTSEWAARLSCTHTAAYAASAEVLAGHSSDYGDKATTAAGHTAVYDETVAVRAWHTTPYSGAVPVRAGLVSPYALTAYALVGHTAKYSDQVPVVLGHTALYHILPYNPVRATHRAPYTLASGSSVELLGDFVVRLRGIEIDCKDVQLDMDEGDAFWTGALTLTSPEDFASIARGDPISVEFYGETFNLLVDSKSIARDSPADVSLSITALSPIAMLDGPGVPSISLTKTLPTSAQDLVEELLGQSVTWQVHSWTIPPYRYAVEDLTPLAAAKVVVEAIGAILRSTAEGTVAVSYRFPTSVPEYSATTPDFVVSDMEDNLSYRGRVQNMDVFNEFRVRDSDGAEADFFEWTPDEGSADSGILRAYLLPWRPAGVESRHTSEVPVNMVYLGVETRTETEEVEIVDGVGSLRFPAVAIASVEWLSSPLGSLYLENRTKDVRAEDTDTNWGYGLVRISYSVECLKYSVQAPTGTSVQFILVDRGI